jgi:hypothetical protein
MLGSYDARADALNSIHQLAAGVRFQRSTHGISTRVCARVDAPLADTLSRAGQRLERRGG